MSDFQSEGSSAADIAAGHGAGAGLCGAASTIPGHHPGALAAEASSAGLAELGVKGVAGNWDPGNPEKDQSLLPNERKLRLGIDFRNDSKSCVCDVELGATVTANTFETGAAPQSGVLGGGPDTRYSGEGSAGGSAGAVGNLDASSPATPEGDAISRGAEEDRITRAVIAKLRNGLIKSCSPSGKRVAFDAEKTRGLMIVAADRLDAQLTRIADDSKRIADLENALAARGDELTAAWHQLAGEALQSAAYGLRRIVEEIDGAMNHGTWRDDHGVRLKDTPEWVAFYNAMSLRSLPPQDGEGEIAELQGQIENPWQQVLRLRACLWSIAHAAGVETKEDLMQAALQALPRPLRLGAALTAQPVAQEPVAFRMVPTEPTPEMIGAWYRYKNGHHYHDEPAPTDRSDYGAYRAMLFAAPAHPATPAPVEAMEVEELIEGLLDAQQDINLAANEIMRQSLCDASALIDKTESLLRRIVPALRAQSAPVGGEVKV